MQEDKRRLMAPLLQLKTASFALDFIVAVLGGYAYLFSQNSCISPVVITFLKFLVIISLFYCIFVLACILITYNSLGSSKLWNYQEEVPSSTDIDKKSERVWTYRLRCLFCFLRAEHKNHIVFKDIATLFVSLFKDVDVVPTDVLTALLILKEKHTEERIHLQLKEPVLSYEISNTTDISCRSWMNCKNALHFLELAKSAYGWIRHDGICLAISTSCFGQFLNNQRIEGTDSCFNCNVTAIKMTTSFNDDDFIYVSYGAKIHEPSFFVAIDRTTSSVVIAIRGTFSFSDLVTVLDAHNEPFRLDNDECNLFAHRGMFFSAQFIRRKLTESNVLKRTFAQYPDFKLVITGHSIGGGTAAILGLLLRRDYAGLKCYAFAPCAVLSSSAAELTQDFTFSIVIGDDFVPKLCATTCNKLKLEILAALAENDMQKYKVTLNACWNLLFKRNIFRTSSCNNNNNSTTGKQISPEQEMNSNEGHFCQLYPPGRILYLEKAEDEYRAYWKTNCEFNRIHISSSMWLDHTPRRIQEYLENVLQLTQSKNTTVVQIASISTPSRSTQL